MVRRDVLLIRHTEVARDWKHRCYGTSDIGLSRAGRARAHELAAELAREPIAAIIHSGLKRSAFLAEQLASQTGLDPIIDTRWRERHFGTWEGRTWQSIYRETGNAMDGMLTHPDTFRPGGGETTSELCARALSAWHSLPNSGPVAVITHNGPIAAIRASLARAPLSQLAHFRIPEGSHTGFAI